MDQFELSDMHQMLADTLRRLFQDRYGFDGRRALLDGESPYSQPLWATLSSELGVVGAAFPEEKGGLGGGPFAHMAILEEFGRALVMEPYLSTAVLAGGLLARLPGAAAEGLLGRIIAGDAVAVLAHAEGAPALATHVVTTAARTDKGFLLQGAKTMVLDAPAAGHLLVSARISGAPGDEQGVSLFLVPADAAGVSRTDYRMIGGAGASDVRFDNVELPADALLGEEGTASPLIAQVMDEGVVALCAEAVGIIDRLVEDTVDYSKQRKQFGRAIAEFQVLQHAMVDMHIAAREARAVTQVATARLGGEPAERAAYASAAKTRVGRACRSVSQAAVQLHGGMGMTDELAIGHLFRRAMMIESQFGTTEEHRRRFEELTFAAVG